MIDPLGRMIADGIATDAVRLLHDEALALQEEGSEVAPAYLSAFEAGLKLALRYPNEAQRITEELDALTIKSAWLGEHGLAEHNAEMDKWVDRIAHGANAQNRPHSRVDGTAADAHHEGRLPGP